MGFVAAKCTECGADIEVDETREAGICKYCGTAFITEKAINNYNVTNNISNSVVHIYNNANDNIFETEGHKLLTYKGEQKVVEVPSYITIIGEMAFSGNINIEKIILPASVTSIENRAFSNCTSLNEIIMPDSIFSIGAMAFGGCTSLEQINLPKRLCKLSVNLFYRCESLKEVLIQNGVTTIESECFDKCVSLKEIVIPNSVKYIEGYPFYKCNLDRIVFTEPNNIEKMTGGLFFMSEKVPEVIASEAFKRKFEKYLTIEEGGANSQGCYVATCVYGSYDCPQVWTLRRFRDYSLKQKWLGRIFIKAYYAIGPKVVRQYGDKVWFNNFWRFYLDKIVADLNRRGVKDTYYKDAIN